jgi:hypothetical protein
VKRPAAVRAREGTQALIGMRHRHQSERRNKPGIVPDAPAPHQPIVVILEDGNWGVVVSRLEEIEAALTRGDAVDDAMREDLLALVALVGEQCEERLVATRRGRREDPQLLRRASVVLALHDSHGHKLEAALNAVCIEAGTEAERRKDRQNVKAAYTKLAKVGGTIRVSDSAVREALERLEPRAK